MRCVSVLSLFAACVVANQLAAQGPGLAPDSIRKQLALAQEQFTSACKDADTALLSAIDAALDEASRDGDFPRAKRLADIKTACETKGLLPTDQELVQAKIEYNNQFLEAKRIAEAAFDEAVAEFTRNGNLVAAESLVSEKASWLQRVGKRKTPLTRYMPAPELPHIANSVGMMLVRLPAGNYVMGTAKGTARRESPPHEVALANSFYMSVHEVTNDQWKKVMGAVPSDKKDGNLPVTRVNWSDAAAFCEKLTAKAEEKASRLRYRLPTEAEWEYACRAGSTGTFCFGDDEALLGDYAWFKGNTQSGPHPVGKKSPNNWGLFDMHGNLLEWVSDWSSDSYYSESPKEDPKGPTSGRFKQSRGGDWGSDPSACRSTTRRYLTTTHRWETLGLRVVGEKF